MLLEGSSLYSGESRADKFGDGRDRYLVDVSHWSRFEDEELLEKGRKVVSIVHKDISC